GFITLFNANRFPTRIAGQVKDFDLGRYIDNPQALADSGSNTRFAVAAASRALTDAGLRDNSQIDRTRVGIYLGSGDGTQDFHHLVTQRAQSSRKDRPGVDVQAFTRGALSVFHRDREYEQEMHTTTAHVADLFDLEGPNFNCLTACAASSQ